MKKYLHQKFDLNDPELVSIMDELPLWSAPFGLRLLDTIKMEPGIQALDVGCGCGFPVLELAQRLGASGKVYGIDPWGAALERAVLKVRRYGLKNVMIIRGVGERLPFRDRSFDLIVSNNGLNNVGDLEATLAECYRVSRPNAQFAFTFNLEETMAEFYAVLRETLVENGLNDGVMKMQEHIRSKRKPLEEVKEAVRRAGFSLRDLRRDSFNIRFSDGSAMLHSFLIRLAFMDPWKEIIDPGDREIIFTRVEDKLNRGAEAQGGVSLTVPFVTLDCRRNG
ncbi:MAG: methyltransferase domain-containing protein [Candidatus Krumholzibacteriota bacterium]|nr:methyltransferase domain-containing protein [Candidatus Krumholzibacteriota bacterium]